MASRVIMPKTGMAMEEGTIVRWLKKVGDPVSKGEAIAVIETDKVTMDLESEYEGTLLAILHRDGETVPATKLIAWIGAPGDSVDAGAVSEARPAAESAFSEPPAAAPVQDAPQRPASMQARAPAGKVPATPASRRLAAESGIVLARVAGSGPGGAVRVRDLPPAGGAPISGMRRAIAEKMTVSHQAVPAVTLVTRADVTELAALRQRINANGPARISYADFIVRAVAIALRENPVVNSLIDGSSIVQSAQVNIGIAVALDNGLIVPVIRDADTLTVRQISERTRDLAERARAGTLLPDECAEGTFTVTNLGMYGITEFTPLINVPQSAIIGIGSIEEAFKTVEGKIQSRRVMSLCLTHDHRLIDGAPAAVFLGRIRALLENCYALLA
jgi:pyruvate dehydrogenase E2 component (dihydrolipoamide acetyltransferase)